MRQDQITKLKALYASLGGLRAEAKRKETNPLEAFAANNIKSIKEIIVEKRSKKDDGDRLGRTMSFLGYSG